MMKQLTKAQLIAENEALRSQINTQHEINRKLISDMATARALIANAQPSPNRIVQPAWQVARLTAMNAAKDEAMNSNQIVKVR